MGKPKQSKILRDVGKGMSLKADKRMLVAFAAISIIAVIVGACCIRQYEYSISRVPIFIVFTALVLIGGILLYVVGKKTGWDISKVFLLLFCIFGIANLIFIPPFSTPDSYEQYLRAYEITQGGIISNVDNVVEMPNGEGYRGQNSLDANLFPGVSTDDQAGYDRHLDMYTVIDNAEGTIDTSSTTEYSYSNMGAYSPINFIPAIAGILLGRLFTNNAWVPIYLARLLQLIAAGIVLYVSIKKIPVAKGQLLQFL